MSVVHVLNGDALAERFPEEIGGRVLIAREALVDGNVSAETPEELYRIRARFIAAAYPGYSESDYREQTVPELEAIRGIPREAEVVLWFEDDLFCQVNLWFVAALLAEAGARERVFLVRPRSELRHGFGGMDGEALMRAYRARRRLSGDARSDLARLWRLYQAGDVEGMRELAARRAEAMPFLAPAVEAHADRADGSDRAEGRPERALRAIVEAEPEADFGRVFQEFRRREPIYGFGDLQVRRLLEGIRARGAG